MQSLELVDVKNGQLFAQSVGPGVVAAVGDGSGYPGQVLVNRNGIDPGSWEKVFDIPSSKEASSSNAGIGYGNGTFVVLQGTRCTQVTRRRDRGVRSRPCPTPSGTRPTSMVAGSRSATTDTGPSASFQSHAVVYESADLATWTKIATLPDNHTVFRSVAVGDGRLVADSSIEINPARGQGAAMLYTSTDGHEWTPTQQTPNHIGVAFGAGAGWLALGYDQQDRTATGVSYRSTDGLTWVQMGTNPVGLTTTGPIRMGDRWYVAGPDQAGRRLESTGVRERGREQVDTSRGDHAGRRGPDVRLRARVLGGCAPRLFRPAPTTGSTGTTR